MSSMSREIIETPFVIVENKKDELDDIPPLEFPRLRRTRTLECFYCKKLWGDVILQLFLYKNLLFFVVNFEFRKKYTNVF